MESLIKLARYFNMGYREFKQLLKNLNIIKIDGIHTKATSEAVKAGVAIELNFNNGMKSKSYHKFNKELLEYHITNRVELEVAEV